MTDLYDLLGVKREATPAAIKAAYRKRAKQAHPDHGGDPKTFALIHRAYKVLSHVERRGRYDHGGEVDELQATNHPDLAAYEHINTLLAQVLGSDEDVMTWNLTARLSGHVGEEIKGMTAKIAKLRRAKDRAEKMRGRILRTDGEENKLAKMFDWHVNNAQAGIGTMERGIGMRKRAIEILKGYEFKADIKMHRVYGMSGSATTGATVFGFGV